MSNWMTTKWNLFWYQAEISQSQRVQHLNNCPEKFGACGSTLHHKRVRIFTKLSASPVLHQTSYRKTPVQATHLFHGDLTTVTVFLMAYLTAKFRAPRRWRSTFLPGTKVLSQFSHTVWTALAATETARYIKDPAVYIQNYPCRYKSAAAKEVAVLFQGRHLHSWSLRLNLGTLGTRESLPELFVPQNFYPCSLYLNRKTENVFSFKVTLRSLRYSFVTLTPRIISTISHSSYVLKAGLPSSLWSLLSIFTGDLWRLTSIRLLRTLQSLGKTKLRNAMTRELRSSDAAIENDRWNTLPPSWQS